MRADIVAGAVFPDYELTDHTGKHRKLSDLQGPDPMILVLSRGGYCPKDLRQALFFKCLYADLIPAMRAQVEVRHLLHS
jgi:peroxiredoxin